MILNSDKFLNMVGLATRAGKVVAGSDGVQQAIRSGKAKLVILADDAARATVKRLTDKCTSYGVLHIVLADKQSLGKMTGGGQAAAIAVTDSNFANELRRINEENTGVYE